MTVREQFTIRPYTPDDYAPMADLANLVSEQLGSVRRVTATELRTYFEAPTFDPANDSFLLERDGQIIAMTDLEYNRDSGRGYADAVVHPDYWHQGIGRQLIAMTEARCMERAQAENPPDLPISIQRYTIDTNPAAMRLFESLGYSTVRTFYRMLVDLDTPRQAPPLPDGIVLRPFDVERDGYAVYETHQEAFADHWGFEPNTFEEWKHYLLDREDNDYSLWQTAYDGDQMAAICLCRTLEEDPLMGWVGQLAVRRPWRKRGLGTALLQRSFALFQQRGCTRAGLGVDASSLTNAVAIYERAGMRVANRTLAYRKMLRGVDTEV